MYQPGEYVQYGIHGICKVQKLEEHTVDHKVVTYYVLEPLEQTGAKYMVPIHNQAAVAKLRPVMTKEALEALLHCPQVRQDAWIADENQRKQHYRELINSGDREALLRMVHTLHIHKVAQNAAGRKFHLCDENFMRDAQRMLNAEFSLVLGLEPNAVNDYVVAALEQD